jgi:hypothetical protein
MESLYEIKDNYVSSEFTLCQFSELLFTVSVSNLGWKIFARFF